MDIKKLALILQKMVLIKNDKLCTYGNYLVQNLTILDPQN